MTRRWQSKPERIGHTDDWLITYADLITLLLCFFVVFFSSSALKKHVPQEPPVQPPVAMALQMPSPPQQSEAQLEAKPAPKSADAIYRNPVPDAAPLDRVAEAPTDRRTVTPHEAPAPTALSAGLASVPVAATDAVRAAPPGDAAPAPLPDLVSDLAARDAAAIDHKGRITALDISSAAFFGSGSATLSDAGKSILKTMAANLMLDPFKGYLIMVEGHTDDTPINTPQFPSNWELSTARASAVVRYFLEQGIPAQRLRAAGYADTQPKVPNRDAEGNPIPENQAQNRRVVIKLERVE